MSELTQESFQQCYPICSTESPHDSQRVSRLPNPEQDSHRVDAARPVSSTVATPSTPHPQPKSSVEDPFTPNNQVATVHSQSFGARSATDSTTGLKSTLSSLPSVSPTYFCQDPPEATKQSDCFIFYDPELNLPPQQIRPTDFNKPLPQSLLNPPTKVPVSSYEPLQIQRLLDFVQGVDANNSAVMAKPLVNVNETLSNQTAIKQKITLSDKDFKTLQNICFKYVLGKENLCKPVPRPWKQKWIGITEEFLEREGYGENYFNSDRATYKEESSLLWPEDKTAISYLVYSLLKQEASKAFSTKGATKRKSILSDAVSSAAKKSKGDTPSATGSKETSGDHSPIAADNAKSSDLASSDSTEDENDEEENLADVDSTGDANMSELHEAEGDTTVDATQIDVDGLHEDEGQEEDSVMNQANSGTSHAINSGPIESMSLINQLQPDQTLKPVIGGYANPFPAKPQEAFNSAKITKQGGTNVKAHWPILGSSFPNQQNAKFDSDDRFSLPPSRQGFAQANGVSGHQQQVTKASKAASLPPLTNQPRRKMQDDDHVTLDYYEFLNMPKTPLNHPFDQDDPASATPHPTDLGYAEEGRANNKATEDMVIKSDGQGKAPILYSHRNDKGQPVDPIHMPGFPHLPSRGESSPVSTAVSSKIEVVYSLPIKHAVKQSRRLITVSSDASFHHCYGRFIRESPTNEDKIALATAKKCTVRGPGNNGTHSFPTTLSQGDIEIIWKSIIKKMVRLTGPECPNEGEMVELEFDN